MNYRYVLNVVRLLLAVLIGVEIAGLMGLFPSLDNRMWPGLLLMSVANWIALECIDRWVVRRNVTRMPGLVVLVGLAVVYLDAVGNMAGWYISLDRFDILVHAATGLIVTAVLFYVVRDVSSYYKIKSGPRTWGYIAWTTMLVLAVLFEMGEWAGDIIFQISFWLGSAEDTLGDLLASMIGGLVALIVLWINSISKVRTSNSNAQ